MKQAMDEGKLGKPALAMVTMLGWREPAYYKSDPWRGTWKGEGGGVVVSQAPHYLDLLCWFMGPAAEITLIGTITTIPALKSMTRSWPRCDLRMAAWVLSF